MFTNPEIVETAEEEAAIIHLTIPQSKIQKVMGPGIDELMSGVRAQGGVMTGPLFAHHLNMSSGMFDFDIGVPVESPVSARGRLRSGKLPGGRVVRTIYRGPYEGLRAAWGELGQWIEAQGYKPRPDLWERYLEGPESGSVHPRGKPKLNQPLAN